MCDLTVDSGEDIYELCPNKGRKILDVAFEKLLPYLNELNKTKKITIDIESLLKKGK